MNNASPAAERACPPSSAVTATPCLVEGCPAYRLTGPDEELADLLAALPVRTTDYESEGEAVAVWPIWTTTSAYELTSWIRDAARDARVDLVVMPAAVRAAS